MGRAAAIWTAGAAAIGFAVCMTACGTSSEAVRSTVIEMDAEIVPVEARTRPGGSHGRGALSRGNEHPVWRAQEAPRRYQYLLTEYPGSDWERPALYNSGLSYEALDRWDLAASTYRDVTERWPESDDAKDALFRWAEARAQLGDWEGVGSLMDRVLRRAGLTVTDKCEAHLRWANSAIEMRDYAGAEMHYREVVEINRDADLNGGSEAGQMPLSEENPIMIQAHFGLGRTYHELFLEIRLVLPQDAILEALIDKSQLLEQAKQAYLDAVQGGDRYWSIAAGFMIGQLYEDFLMLVARCHTTSMRSRWRSISRSCASSCSRSSSGPCRCTKTRWGWRSEWGRTDLGEETRPGIERIQGICTIPRSGPSKSG
jgi:hypothetical protein